MRILLIAMSLLIFSHAANACEGFNNAMDALEHDIAQKQVQSDAAAARRNAAMQAPAAPESQPAQDAVQPQVADPAAAPRKPVNP